MEHEFPWQNMGFPIENIQCSPTWECEFPQKDMFLRNIWRSHIEMCVPNALPIAKTLNPKPNFGGDTHVTLNPKP
jgi:hypothetical protein